MKKLKVGVIGCGKISGAYLNKARHFDCYEITACADLELDRAVAKAEEFSLAKACTVEELLADPEIDIVINLTIPQAHTDICLKALNAGKHVYVEKPLAITKEEGKQIVELAAAKGLRAGCAPDTFLGGGIQTSIKLIEDGWIGTPIGATAFMIGRGHEHWHPAPDFYYKVGGGPMFDMGPYYLTALVAMIGPIRKVAGMTSTAYPERKILSQPLYGQMIQVDVPTHVAGLLEFHSGAIGTIITSFDAFGGTSLPRIEVYGSQGTLIVPDPNTFGGSVQIRRVDKKEFVEVPHTHGFTEAGRGLGVADMAQAILSGRPHRASAELAYHVLEAMEGFHIASDGGRHYEMTSSCQRPTPLPLGLSNVSLDA
ncbi:Gfo/Idh/MocA family protein [Paenibacillus koleovorans]|uniref:Gfo/Idh/MocA family protein n=1 Tax=Paenibacillus koleovorans TaxID=121608 RepID=UPI000FDB5E6D|nr:Gfo/Idh/MocA family oxidoreductase [Paenibacillus koleovorans]